MHEPVLAPIDPQQQRGAVQRGGMRGGPPRVGEPGVPDDMDVGAAGGSPRAASEPCAVIRGGGCNRTDQLYEIK